MSDNHDLLNDNNMCYFEEHEAENVCFNKDAVARGDCGRTTQKGYIEILEFTYFVEFFSFNRIAENHKEKELVRNVTAVVALDLGCGNTNNSEYESK
jgi:hypothetical protein